MKRSVRGILLALLAAVLYALGIPAGKAQTANYDRATVEQNMKLHDPKSPFLIGGPHPADIIKDADQESWLDLQTSLF